MDKFDQKILQLVQRDAALSVGAIAERISLSKTACWRRLQKLEQDGVIKARVALLDAEALNLGLTVYIVVRTNQHNEDWAAQFRAVVEAIPQVLELYRLSGELDYLLKAVVTDMEDYDRLYKRLITADLFDVSSSFVMETMKQTTEMPLHKLPLKP